MYNETAEIKERDEKKDFYKILYDSVMWSYNIQTDAGSDFNTAILAGKRDMEMLKAYSFYRNHPHLAFDNGVWFEAFPLIDKIFEQARIF